MLKIPALNACLFVFFCPALLVAQISDDFSDGNITDNPAWQGETSEFIVNAAGELQLNAPDAGTSVLAVQGNIPNKAVWQLDVRLEFAPSTSNLLRVYLQADRADLLSANGYYLEIGEIGSADALRFYRQDGASKTLLSTGVPGFVAVEPVNIQLQIKRSNTGNWTIYAAPKGGAFQVQGTVTDANYAGAPDQFFGLYCLYSATRKDKFFFDSLLVQSGGPDVEPPVLLSARAIDAHTVGASFDESLDPASALDPANYQLSGVGEPADVSFAAGSQQEVRLSFPDPISSGTYTLETTAVADILGNPSGVQTITFEFFKAFDVLINEIMANPAPTQGLPNAEWLELYNRGTTVVELDKLRLSDGGAPQALPAYLLYPDSFVVLTTDAGADALAAFTPNVRAMSGFPSLNNAGDALVLTDAAGNTMDRVTYSVNWHTDISKIAGGWTLERINPLLPCLGGENWQSCPVKPGGTPGASNAALDLTPDTQAPRLSAVFPESATSLRIFFSEGMDLMSMTNPAAYRIFPDRGIGGAVLPQAGREEVRLLLDAPLEAGEVYMLIATAQVVDCSGNPVPATDTLIFGLPEAPQPRDLVINEILFNPETGGADFVEVHNRSNKVIGWQDLFFDNYSDNAGSEPIALERILLPGDYAAFTLDTRDVLNRFANVRPAALYEHSIPALADDAGNLTLFYAKDGVVITVDSFNYLDDYHNALLATSERDGVALERIRPEGATNDPANWTSATRTSFGAAGTPTRPNSQRLDPGNAPEEDLILLDPARLSPDGDGYEDFLDIYYQLPAAGYAATITIYDSEGVPVKRLVRQDLIGVEGALRWDGDRDDGTRARPGIYILFAEVFTPTGAISRVKKPFALVTRY